MADPFVPAFAPAVLVVQEQRLGGIEQRARLLNGNVSLLDYFAARMFGELASAFMDPELPDARLDDLAATVWRGAAAAMRTRPEPGQHETKTGKPLTLLGGAA